MQILLYKANLFIVKTVGRTMIRFCFKKGAVKQKYLLLKMLYRK